MKAKLLPILLLVFIFSSDLAFASFPVERSNASEVTTTETSSIDNEDVAEISSPAAVAYNKWIAVALWFFLGAFAAHRWYAKKPVGWNILFIVTLGGLGVWWVIDLINILTDNF